MKELLDRIESCNYECEAGPLTGNVDWIELRKQAILLQEFADYMRNKRGLYACSVSLADPLDQPDAE